MLKQDRPSSSFPGDRSLFRIDMLSTSLPNIVSDDWFDLDAEQDQSDSRSQIPSETPLISVKIVTTSDSYMETEMMDSTQVNIDNYA